jgi:hypothetical protein
MTEVAWSRRNLSRALIGFGATGLVLTIALGIAVVAALGTVAGLASSLESQRAAATKLLAPASAALHSAASSAGHAGASLAGSESAARDGAAVTGQLADAMGGLAAFSSAFADVASRSRALSDNLTRTADSLHRNQADTAAVAFALEGLASEVDSLRASVDGSPSGGGGTAPPSGSASAAVTFLGALLIGLFAWLGALALGSLWLGLRWRRFPASQEPPTS